ncbi:hypothetical protein K3495_g15810 [Podosphaera aphanis]|nr:hypothetical protein K3495_g15810 [Podosphaera aphanis]
MFYLSKQIDLEVSILSEYPDDPDILAASFKNKKYNFNIINIYNQKNQKNENNLTTIERHKNNLQVQPRSIVLGDFNEHHPDWDPQQPKSNLADNLKEWFEKQGLSLVTSRKFSGTNCVLIRSSCINRSAGLSPL